MIPDFTLMKQATICRCPRCGKGHLFEDGRFTMALRGKCAYCGLNLQKNDSADGPAVFMIFILSFALVPLALWLDSAFSIPLWMHAVLWLGVTLGLTLISLKPLKSYVIALQFKYRPQDWE